MKTLPTITEIRNVLISEIASATGESKASVSLEISEFRKENETYSITGTYTIAPFLFITKSGKFNAAIVQTDGELRIVRLRLFGDEEL